MSTSFFACELAKNGELIKYLSSNATTTNNTDMTLLMCRKMYEAALGLQFLHSQNVVHSDLKCDNVLVDAEDNAKLIDFGLSSILNEAEVQVDIKKIGAVHWRSPEYLGGARPSFASDVYSFAMSIIEVMSSDVPWGRNVNPSAVRYHMKKGGLPDFLEAMTAKQRNLIE